MSTVVCASYEWNLGFVELRALQNAGFELHAVHSGAAALAQLDRGEADALVVSRTLPDMEVGALVEHVKARRPELPIIMITGSMPQAQDKPKLVDSVIAKSHAAGLLVPTLELLLSGLPEDVQDAAA